MTESPENHIHEQLEDKSFGSDNKGAQKLKFGKKLQLILQAIKPIITSHHPLCDQYREHTFHLLGRDWCIGCYIGYPSGILMLIIGYTTGLFESLQTSTLWIIGICLITTYILSIVGLTKTRWVKILSKIPIGAGAAFLIAAIFSYPIKFWLSFLLSFFLIQTFVLIINAKRAFEMKKTCAECNFKSDHNICPGMHPVMEKLKQLN